MGKGVFAHWANELIDGDVFGVQRIVMRLGGQVGVESAPGQGSIFSFMLPDAALD